MDNRFDDELERLFNKDIKLNQLKGIRLYLEEIEQTCYQAIIESKVTDKPIDLIIKVANRIKDDFIYLPENE